MIKEPLFHFLFFAVLIFAYFEFFPSLESSEQERYNIVIGEPELQRLQENWVQSWRKPPSDEQLAKLIENAVKEEIYYREGLILGLDKDDSVVRNRMVQKMRFMHSEELREPTQTELLELLKRDANKYKPEPLYSFEQIYLGQHYDASAATEVIKQLNSQQTDATELGEPLSVANTLDKASGSLIARQFGSKFAETITSRSHTPSKWFGPVGSGFGIHLVRINNIQDDAVASLDDASIRQRVLNDWRAEQGEALEQRIFSRLQQKYTVKISQVR